MSLFYSNPGDNTDITHPPRLPDRLGQTLCTKHYVYTTEQAYVHWVRRYIVFHNKRHPQEMGGAEIERFLTHLAVAGQAFASTQTQALCALLLLNKYVLKNRPRAIDAMSAN